MIRITGTNSKKSRVSFPRITFSEDDPIPDDCTDDDPLIIRADIGTTQIYRIYVDGGSSTEIMFEHYFEQLQAKEKKGNPTTYDPAGGPGMMQLGTVTSTLHALVKFQTQAGIAIIKADSFPPALFDQLLGEIRAFSQHENESLTDAWLRMKEMLRNCLGHNLSKGNIIKIFYHGLNEITQEVLNAATGGSSNSDIDKIMARMDAMTIKMDAQYKDFQSRAKQPTPDLDEDDMPMSREEEAKFMQTFRKTRFYNDYRDRDSNRDNWRSSKQNNYNRDNYQSNTDDKSYDLQRQFNNFMKSQQSTNAFVKDTFMDLKTQLETVAKNHQALIQNLETNIDVIDEILEEDFDSLLDKGSKILYSIEGTILEEEIFSEFDKFIAMAANENYDSESDEEELKFEKITINTNYKIKTSLEEPPTDLELKSLPDNLEYVFLEEPSFLPVILSSQLSAQNKSKLKSVLKNIKKHLLEKQQTFL
ncbi:hypothetical protein Tco_0562426, partial [Tanacetum coccineum]